MHEHENHAVVLPQKLRAAHFMHAIEPTVVAICGHVMKILSKF